MNKEEFFTLVKTKSFPFAIFNHLGLPEEIGGTIRSLKDLSLFPRYLRSDNGPEFIAQNLTTFLKDQKFIPSRIEPGKPWQNGSNESCNGTFRRECLDAELFHNLAGSRVVIEDWRRLYNHEWPHSALGYQLPAVVFEGIIIRKT